MKTPEPLTDGEVLDLITFTPVGVEEEWPETFARAIEAARDAQWIKMLQEQEPAEVQGRPAENFPFVAINPESAVEISECGWEVRKLYTHPLPKEDQGNEIANLREALRWYAEGHHFRKADQEPWDTVSGEPQNWWCDESGTAMVEDGSLAAMVLNGELTGAQLHELEDCEKISDDDLPTAPKEAGK